MTLDWTFRISDLLVLGGGILSFVWMAIHVRDSIRDLTQAVGSRKTNDGLWGVVTDLKRDHSQLREEVTSHREWILQHDAANKP